MFAPAPPRCWTRSSTRNDSETFSIWPSTNCSVNFPGKVIRWSVAMEPVTATGTERSLWTGSVPTAAQRTARTLGERARRGSVGQRPAQREPELHHADEPEHRSRGRTPGDHEAFGVEPGENTRA